MFETKYTTQYILWDPSLIVLLDNEYMFIKNFVGDMPIKEAAERLGISEYALKNFLIKRNNFLSTKSSIAIYQKCGISVDDMIGADRATLICPVSKKFITQEHKYRFLASVLYL